MSEKYKPLLQPVEELLRFQNGYRLLKHIQETQVSIAQYSMELGRSK